MAMLRSMSVLQVHDVDASIKFYERLRLISTGVWGEPSNFSILQRGQVTIGLERIRPPADTKAAWSVYIYVDDVNGTYEEFVLAGIHIDRKTMDRAYGCRDFELSDPDGHRICFGQDLNPVHGPGLAKVEN